MKKIFYVLIALFSIFIFTDKVSAEECKYSDDKISLNITIENNNITYDFKKKTVTSGLINQDYELKVSDFDSDGDGIYKCLDSISYKLDESSGYNFDREFYTFAVSGYLNTLKLEVNDSSTSESDSNDVDNTTNDNVTNDNATNDNSIQVNNSIFGNLPSVKCGNVEIPAPIPPIIRTIVNIIKIATPFVLIIMGMIDMLKAVVANDEKKIKEEQLKFPKRLMSAAIVFFVVAIVQFIVGLVADDSRSFANCINCMISDASSCIKVDKPVTPPIENNGDDDDGGEDATNFSKSYIKNIKNDGVIVTITAENVDGITGYYFSYSSKRPNKETGGYISTSSETLDVVRLPGTTYVWVEDSQGKISKSKKITLSNDVLLITKDNREYTVLKGTNLSKYLENHGWSLTEFNNLIYRSARAAGLYTKEAAATTGVALQTVLAQKYRIKLPYRLGGKVTHFGAAGIWGAKYGSDDHYALDCDGFTNWAYINAGMNINYKDHYYFWSTIPLTKENGEVGDIIVRNGHVSMIVGKTNKGFIIAEAYGESDGMVVNIHEYSKSSGYGILKGDTIIEKYTKKDESEYPSGF